MYYDVAFILFAVVAILPPLFARPQQQLQPKLLATLHQWTDDLALTFAHKQDEIEAIKRGHYRSNSAIPVDVDIEYGDDGDHRTFLTIPRLSLGIPYSLATIDPADNAKVWNPRLQPYPPAYGWHSPHGTNCSAITSAIRTFIDECWRLWVMDSGQINAIQYCPPQILAFDLVTDTLIHRYQLPSHLYIAGVSVFTALTVNVDGGPDCRHRNATIYIADPWGYGLIVYDVALARSWRIEHNYMRADENLRQLNSAHDDGIFTISLSPVQGAKHRERRLYFHALNSFKEISIPLSVVNNASLWMTTEKMMTVAASQFRVEGNRGTQCESETMDSAGNMYCSLLSSNALISWKEGDTYNSDTLRVVAYSPEQLRFVTGLKINMNTWRQDELWLLSTDPKLFMGEKSLMGKIKFQILGCRSLDLLHNNQCSVQARSHNSK